MPAIPPLLSLVGLADEDSDIELRDESVWLRELEGDVTDDDWALSEPEEVVIDVGGRGSISELESDWMLNELDPGGDF